MTKSIGLIQAIQSVKGRDEAMAKETWSIKYIIVQAGGKGTRMEQLTRNKPKALVPVGNLPILFHLFRKYPKARFIIIGDYKFEVLRRYLEAFADVSWSLICAAGRRGTCAGIPDALSVLPEDEPFMLIWSDLVLPADFEVPEEPGNYIGISKDFRCRWSWDGELKETASTDQGVAGLFIFKNKAQISQVPTEGEFVRWLRDKEDSSLRVLSIGKSGAAAKAEAMTEAGFGFLELPLYKTKEYGLIEEYNKENASMKSGRCRPFNRITIEGDRVIKEGIDEQGRELSIREKAWYEKVRSRHFVNIPVIYETEPLIMERIDGKNIYDYELSHDEKIRVLKQLIDCISELHRLDSCPPDRDSYYEAYIGKTFDRLEKVRGLVPFADEECVIINGIRCRNAFFIKDELEKRIMEYLPERFVFLHGDCTFSNMLLREGKVPVMIDPRGYFGRTELFGDPAYDWAKLYYSIAGNYDQFNLRRFSLNIEENGAELTIESNHWEDMEEEFFRLLKGEVSKSQMKLIHAIIYLSLTTYAWDDYDSICGAFYKGLLLLEEAFKEAGK